MAWIEPRSENGTKWLLCVSNGSKIESEGENKKNKRVTCTKIFYGTDKQAQKKADEWEHEIKNGLYFPEGDKATLATFINTWKSDYAEDKLAPRTMARYEKLIEVGILPLLGHIRLNRITPVVVNKWRKELEGMDRQDGKEGKLSAQTIKHYLACLSAILGKAEQWEIIRANPCIKAEKPKVPKAKVKVFNEEESVLFIQRLEEKADLKHRALIWLELDTYMRREEIMGLDWPDFDFDNDTVSIYKTSQYLSNLGVFEGPTKNESSTRVIAVDHVVMELMAEYKAAWEEHRKEMGDLWQGSNRVFTTWDGRPGFPDMPQKWLTAFLKREELPHCSFHSLRHLGITIQIKAHVQLSQVSKRAGHSVVGTTNSIYEEVIQSVDREAAEKQGAILREMKNKKVSGQLVGNADEKEESNVADFNLYKSKKARKEGKAI
ncbi:MAG: tyrosine-type recombinase/integrase [Ignavibacteriales bacterium]